LQGQFLLRFASRALSMRCRSFSRWAFLWRRRSLEEGGAEPLQDLRGTSLQEIIAESIRASLKPVLDYTAEMSQSHRQMQQKVDDLEALLVRFTLLDSSDHAPLPAEFRKDTFFEQRWSQSAYARFHRNQSC
jgi:hypothetical protein